MCAIMLDVDPSQTFDFKMDNTNSNEPMENTLNTDVCTENNPQEDTLHDDHGLVDTHDLNQLQERFYALETSHGALNANVTTLTELVKTFMQTMAHNSPMGETNTTRTNVSIAPITRETPLPRSTTSLMGTMVGSIPILVDEFYEGGPS